MNEGDAEPAPGTDAPVADRGDPGGRRVARRRAGLLGEAARVSRALELLLDRADFPRDRARELTAALTQAEQENLLRAEGHVETRRRFKGGQVQIPAPPDRHLLFIDEAGKSMPSATEYFALGGVGLTALEAQRYIARANAVKERFWGREGVGITFHEPNLRRRVGPFALGNDAARQAELDAAVDELIQETDFVVFGVGVRKTAFADFASAGGDPYLPADTYAVAIQLLLERYVDYRASTSNGIRTRSYVMFEAQGPREDAIHQRDYADTLVEGTQWVPQSAFQQWLETGIRFPTKQGSDPMELADMVSRDMYEWLTTGCTGWPGRWRTFSERIYSRDDQLHGKFGVKVFPDSDIRSAVLDHRRIALDDRNKEAPAPRGSGRR